MYQVLQTHQGCHWEECNGALAPVWAPEQRQFFLDSFTRVPDQLRIQPCALIPKVVTFDMRWAKTCRTVNLSAGKKSFLAPNMATEYTVVLLVTDLIHFRVPCALQIIRN